MTVFPLGVLAGRVDLLLRYVDLYYRTELADLS